MIKKILQFFLRLLTVLIIKKYHPKIIAVTGSVGKTSTKEGIYTAFCGLKNLRKSAGNLNTEIGAPLLFWNVKKAGENIKEWLLILLKGLYVLFFRDKNYPEIVVCELAADKPGDMEYLSSFIVPDISIVTAVGDVPVHVEFYKNAEEVAKEKAKLIKKTKKEGTVVLNFDDAHVLKMKGGGRSITFGFNKKADIHIKNFVSDSFKGSSLTIFYKNKDFSLFLSRCIGESFAYVAGAVFATGLALGIEAEKLPKMIEKIRPAKGRLYPIKGEKDTFVLDGSYNASPSSMASALRALKNVPGKRKIAVLGDMLELGKFSVQEHRKLGKEAAKFCDYLFAVGEWATEVKKSAVHGGMKEEKTFTFLRAEDAAIALEKIISPKDVVLVKGSQKTRTERVVFSIMRDPERAEELLVRQTSQWKKKKI